LLERHILHLERHLAIELLISHSKNKNHRASESGRTILKDDHDHGTISITTKHSSLHQFPICYFTLLFCKEPLHWVSQAFSAIIG